LQTNLSTSKTKIDFAFDKNVPTISIDKIQIQQVVLNLIQNGIESMLQNHTREKRIHIQSKSTATNMIEVTITDAGPGFSKEIINKVFKPFFTTKAHGRGMGLAICRSIIEAHGGEFTINPNTHTNSWIRFSLPFMEKSYD
jgi:two-component system sensor kinase FixL